MKGSKYLKEVLDVANTGFAKYQKHGALLIRNGRVISSGVNNDNFHAEKSAIMKIYKNVYGVKRVRTGRKYEKKVARTVRKCSMVIIKHTMNKSKPCLHCLDFLKKCGCGIRKVYYSCNQKLIEEKTCNMQTEHLTIKYRKPFNQQIR